MITIDEYRATNHSFSRGRDNHQPLGNRKKFSITHSSACSDYSSRSQRCFQPQYCPSTGTLSSDYSALARSFLCSAFGWSREGCPSPRTASKNQPTKSDFNCQCDATTDTSRCNTLEHPKHGQSSWRQQRYCFPYLERIQSQTTFGRDFQAQPRQKICRKTSRCGWALSESARQSSRLLRRRKEPNSGIRPNAAFTAITPWYSRAADSRLHATRYDNFIRGIKPCSMAKSSATACHDTDIKNSFVSYRLSMSKHRPNWICI